MKYGWLPEQAIAQQSWPPLKKERKTDRRRQTQYHITLHTTTQKKKIMKSMILLHNKNWKDSHNINIKT